MYRTFLVVTFSVFGFFSGGVAQAQEMFPSDQCAVVVASRPDIGTARQYIYEQGWQSRARMFEGSNGWFAIVSDTISNEGSSLAIEKMKASDLVPEDAFCSLGRSYVREVDWRSINGESDQSASASLWSEFDARPLTQTEKRFLQAALAMEGYYAGLLDGAWGRGSQGALDRYAAEQFDGSKPANAHAGVLAAVTLNRWIEEGWAYEYIGHLDISTMLPTKLLNLVEEDGTFQEWHHVSKDLVIFFNDLNTRQLTKLHQENVENADVVRAPYTLRNPTTWITSMTTSKDTVYIRSDLIAATWSTIYVVGDRSLQGEVGLISSSIRPGSPAEIVPSGNDLLISYASEIVALIGEDTEPTSPPPAAEMTRPNPPRSASEERPRRSTGTAFFVTDRGVALTNAHVVDGCISLALGGQPAEIVSVSAAFDLAAIRLSIPEDTTPLPFARRDAGLNSDITIAGYPLHGLLGGLNVSRGSVSSLKGLGGDETSLQISAPVQPGNSGGPVVNRYGGVVGVVVSKLNAVALAEETGDIAQNINFAIRSSLAKVFLSSNGIAFDELDDDNAMLPEAAAKLLQASTSLVECN